MIVFWIFVFTACTEKKSEKEPKKLEETSAKVEYQCPMDCKEGKTYHASGSWPVCKMDLKAKGATSHGTSCTKHEDGKCSCKGEKCKCKNCSEHA